MGLLDDSSRAKQLVKAWLTVPRPVRMQCQERRHIAARPVGVWVDRVTFLSLPARNFQSPGQSLTIQALLIEARPNAVNFIDSAHVQNIHQLPTTRF